MPSVSPSANRRLFDTSRHSSRSVREEELDTDHGAGSTSTADEERAETQAQDSREDSRDEDSRDEDSRDAHGPGRRMNARGGGDGGVPAKARASPPVSAGSAKPSFLSRLNIPLPLRNRNRNVNDFHIRCDEPYKKYNAGENVRGAVILAVVKPLRITHLVVCLHGFVQVFKDAVASAAKGPGYQFPQGDGSGRPQYHGNGFASLFSDEQVLSGEGRLDVGKYEFNFDLMFPDRDLPSSIEFERGSISYLITATLTRPTSIAPVSSCDRKVLLVESRDIGLLRAPRPRSIFLEPISKRTRKNRSMMTLNKASTATSDLGDGAGGSEAESRAASEIDDSERDRSLDQRSAGPGAGPSDNRSEPSGESVRSGSTARSRADTTPLSASQARSALPLTAKQQAVDNKTITATIELLKGGCLPGDMVSVRVTVQHVKQIKSMTGVIVTLFRQGKMDSSPSPSRFADGGRTTHREDSYPKSRARGVGLSMTSRGSTSVFRKDLDQNLVPLFIDPVSLKASVTISVKLPDDAFPTIRGVPGDMVSFRYQVEVIVDLSGRLSNQIQGTVEPNLPNQSAGTAAPDSSFAYGSIRATHIADTAPLRREKGVISMSFETVVGTVDSSRIQKTTVHTARLSRNNRDSLEQHEPIHPELGYVADDFRSSATPRSTEPVARAGYFAPSSPYYEQPPPGEPPPSATPPPPPPHPNVYPQPSSSRQLNQIITSMGSRRGDAPAYSPSSGSFAERHGDADPSRINGVHDAAPVYIPPPPQVPDRQNMSEKDRIREAETRLLPSQPSAIESSHLSAAADEDLYSAEDATTQTQQPQLQSQPPPRSGSRPVDDREGEEAGAASAPRMEDVFIFDGPTPNANEDKQELERRRLQLEASAPPEVPEDVQGTHVSHQARLDDDAEGENEPTAPFFQEEEAGEEADGPSGAGPSRSARDEEQLPAYQR